MGNKTVNDFTALASVASSDYALIWDTSLGATRKSLLSSIYDLLLSQANTFTNGQTIIPTGSSTIALLIDAPAGATNDRIRVRHNGVTRYQWATSDSTSYVQITSVDIGADNGGPMSFIGRNSNPSGPAAGVVRITNRSGSAYSLWPDASGNLRIHTTSPTDLASDTAGTVVGTQTSMAEAKFLLGEAGPAIEALEAIVDAARHGIRRFSYKNGAFDQEFEGIITDYAPRYGMDRDEQHPAGKSLNEIQLLGDLVRSVALIADKLGLTQESN